MTLSKSAPASATPKVIDVALFGPQATHWTRESLSTLQSALLHDRNLQFLTKALVRLSSLWPTLDSSFSASGFDGEGKLKELEAFATGGAIPDSETLTNTHLAPLTVVSQVLDFVRCIDGPGKEDTLSGFEIAQGFCIGFLSAAALASSSNWIEFERNICNSLRLAACIGIIVDIEDGSHALPERATALSLRWKTASDKTFLETSLDLFPDAYVSCVTDDQSLTISLPNRNLASFGTRLNGTKISTTVIGIDGSYHHSKHTEAAEMLKELCAEDTSLRLPSADKLQLPLRSTADAGIITSGALHDIAIDLILCKRAHWFQTVKLTIGDAPLSNFKFTSLGNESCIPRSLLPTKLNLKNSAAESTSGIEQVAVVGMACRFAEADSLEEFWQLISSGGISTTKCPIERFSPADVSRQPELATYWGNFLRRPDAFDHRFFNVSGREAKSMDPQQRLALQVSYEALESSGYCSLLPTEQETNVGCYIGAVGADYEDNVASENANAFSATGTLRAFISGRISHHFGWTGPSIVLDTACSSSAVAIHTACKALIAGECSMALAGGVNVITSPNMYQNLSAGGFLNPNGSSKAFDAAAGGYCRGEGAGILVLKPLSKAIANGDNILGVIAGSAVNQGSNCSSITVPDSQSQSSLYRQALSLGQLEPKDITYVEAHGTGTQVGDPIEYESVRAALTGPWRNEDLFLGSVKDSIGHAEAASGVAGVIKTLLMMQHKAIPKQAGFASLNPRIKASPADRIRIPQATQPWTAQSHVALVNNYGAAGSNAAIVLRDHPQLSSRTKQVPPEEDSSMVYPILLSAKSSSNIESYVDALKSYLPMAASSIGNIAYNIAQRHNSSFDHRVALTASSCDTLTSSLNASDTALRTKKLPVVLAFGGQTGRVVTISQKLYDDCDLLRSHLNQCDAVCLSLGLPSIFPRIFQADPTDDIVSLHCQLLSLQVSTAKCWIDSGLEIETLVGHSFGQLAALCVADSISLKDAFRLVSGRSRLIQDNWGPERGVMLSAECDREELDAMVARVNSTSGFRVDVACYNGPRSFVLAGDAASMAKVEEECRTLKTKRLQNTHAYHSYCADGIIQGLKAVAESIQIQPPRISIETCSENGSWSQFTADELVQHTRQPVYFGDAVERIAARLPSAMWLEAGSASPILAMARRILRKPDRSDVFIPIDLGTSDATGNLANAACQLWKAGSAAQYWLFHRFSGYRYKTLNLPPYQFDKTPHWIDFKSRLESPPPTLAQTPVSKTSNLVNLVKNGGETGEHLFSVDTFHADFDLAVRGHAVTGQSLCPASMYMEMALRCVMTVVDDLSETETVPHIEWLTMSAPLGLGGESAVFMRLQKNTSTSTWDFRFFSQSSVLAEDLETEHAKGRLNLVSAGDVVAESRLKMLKRYARLSRADRVLNLPSAAGVSGAMVYKLFSDVVDYANYYCGVKSLSASENEAVASVTVPMNRPFGMGADICDPITVDYFLQVAGIHVNCLSNRKDDEVLVCNAVEEIVFSSAFMTNRDDSRTWIVHSQYEITSKATMSNDIFVYDANSKELVLAILGAIFRNVPYKSLAKSLTKLNLGSNNTKDPKSISNMPPRNTDLQSQAQDPTPTSGGYEKEPTIPLPDKKFVTESTSSIVQSQPLREEPKESSNVLQLVREMLSSIIEIPVQEIEPTSSLDDIGIDSLLATEVLGEVRKRFQVDITQAQFLDCADVNSLCRLIQPNGAIASHPKLTDPTKGTNDIADQIVAVSTNSASETDGNGTECGKNLAVISEDCFNQAKSSFDEHAETTGFTSFCTKSFPLQSALVVQYVLEAFASLGSNLEDVDTGDEVPTFNYDTKHKKLVAQLHKLLEEAGLLKKDTSGTFRRTAKTVPTVSSKILQAEMLEKFPKHASETKLLHTTAHRLADCLTGAADPLALLFRDASTRALHEDVYTNAPMFKAITLLLSQYLYSVLDRFGSGRQIKIVEIGAGTGGTTQHLVEALARLDTTHDFSYTFTDLSPSLIANARRKFSKWPFMRYALLDIEKEPGPQFAGAYDIIISTNCIHATKDLVQTTTNIRKMLRPDGVLCLVEATRNLFWFDLVWGLVEGWWLFDDGREHALAHEHLWEKSLRAAGFQWVDWSDSPSSESDILRVITASPFNAAPSVNTRAIIQATSDVKSGENHNTRQTMVFKEVDGLELLADIYYPANAVDPTRCLPVALMIHGGGHIMLSRKDIRPEQTDMLLKSGFLPISIDYRLCPETKLREGPMTDVRDALEWVRKVLPELELLRTDVRVDGKKVVAVGWSTGGTLAMSLAWTGVPRGVQPPDAILAFYCPTDYQDPFWIKPNVPIGSEVTTKSAAADSYELDDATWAGVSDRPITAYNPAPTKRALGGWMAPSDPRSRLVLYMNWHGRSLHVLVNGLDKQTRKEPSAPATSDVAAISPLAQIHRGTYTTPTFIIHPREDDLIPWQQAKRTSEALSSRGVETELRIVENVPHLFDLYRDHQTNEATRRAVREGYEFLCRYVGLSLHE